MSNGKKSPKEGTGQSVAVLEQTETESTTEEMVKQGTTSTPDAIANMLGTNTPETPLTISNNVYAQRIRAIANSTVIRDIGKLMKKDQHYIIMKERGEDQFSLTRDGWSLIAATFGVNLTIVEEVQEDIYDYPGNYLTLRDAYDRNVDLWIAGDLSEEAGERLAKISTRLGKIFAEDVRPTRRLRIKVKVRAEFTRQNTSDPVFFREEIGSDMITPGEYRTEFFKLLTRTSNRAIRNLIGGVCGEQIIGNDEERPASKSRSPR